MPTFQEELDELLARNLAFEELSTLVNELHRKHGRELPPAIRGTLSLVEPKDAFSRR